MYFPPMGVPGDSILQLAPLVLAFIGLGVGFYWIHRIAKDIEDN
jgi:hypothetical protein